MVSELAIFDLKEFKKSPFEMPDIFKQTATIVQPSNSAKPVLKLASGDYKLKHYLNEEPDSRPAFFSPENDAGPDLIFFIKFHDDRVIPVILQLKLRKTLSKGDTRAAISTCDPHEFYRYRKGERIGEMRSPKVNEPVVKKMLDLCNHGILQIIVAYPADPSVTPKKTRSQPARSSKRVTSKAKIKDAIIGKITIENAERVFNKDHLAFLDTLKNVTTNTKRKYEEHASSARKRSLAGPSTS